ncbi:MAG: 30S ribosomal protein S4 [Erysipelotrichia bacterium]|nr:30S ribosomal protein S4 [Candidatus Riflebacteria bacterium]NCB37930.1 30S ribosomal protein S4 [Erysipelotrichia bacterium]
MARYTGSVCRICRREGDQLFLKGARCFTEKCAFKRRATVPGQHGSEQMRKKSTGYEVQLRAKQKLRKTYGILERQFRKYYEVANRKSGNTGVNLLHQLETRLDNVAFRMGFGISRAQTRMWVTQGHFEINGHKCNIPSYQLRAGDVVSIRESSKIKNQIKDALEITSSREASSWLEVDRENLKGKFAALPERSQLDQKIQEHLIVEFYSR